MVINIDSSEQSSARLQLQPTLGARAPPRSASGSGAPSRQLTEARTAANHYGPESTTQGQTSGIMQGAVTSQHDPSL